MFELGAIIVLIALGGWILGIVGFFNALSAHSEIRRLRRAMAAPSAVPAQPWPMPAPEPVAEPPPAPQPMPATQPVPVLEPTPAAKRPRDIEALLTLRWGVWLGAAALVLAGVFLIRYAVDEGLLGPAPRCGLAGLLGVALIFAAEWLRRRELSQPFVADHAAPGLAAGGIAVLFGAAYGAGVMYALVPPAFGFILLAAASLAGLALSLRYGQLAAAVGVVGAFVTPALVATANPSLAGLFAYLLFVTATAQGIMRYTAWTWLGWAA